VSDIRHLIDLVESAQGVSEDWGSMRNAFSRKEPVPASVDLSRLDRREPAHTQDEVAPILQDGAPALCTEFVYGGKNYVVTGYFREKPKTTRVFGRRGARPPLIACQAHQATWVHGLGHGSGCVAPVIKIKPTNRTADWSDEQTRRVQLASDKLIANAYEISQPNA
jgi:hypothetical protein